MNEIKRNILEEGTDELKSLSKVVSIMELEEGLRNLWQIVANSDIFKKDDLKQVDILFHQIDKDNAAKKIKGIWGKVHDEYKIEELLEILKENMILTSKEGEIKSFTKMDYSGPLNTGGYFYIRDFDGHGDTHNWDNIKKYIISKIKEL